MKFGRCIESCVVTVYAVNDTGTIYNALWKFGTLGFVCCMGENVVNGVRSNEVRLYVGLYSLLVIPAVEHANEEFCVLGMRPQAPLYGWEIRNIPDQRYYILYDSLSKMII